MIVEGRKGPARNMAADAYLLETAHKRNIPPVLRIYGWEMPSVTIGYHQIVDRALDIRHLGVTPVAKRPTGGRALLHDDGELTYAVAGNYKIFPALGDTLRQSYLVIARALVGFYRKLDWPAAISSRPDPIRLTGRAPIQKGCFASVSRYEVVAFGRKMAASSQRRTRSAMLQHGAVRFCQATPHPAISQPANSEDSALLPEITESRTKLTEFLIDAFSETLNVGFENRPFTASELSEIEAAVPSFKIPLGV